MTFFIGRQIKYAIYKLGSSKRKIVDLGVFNLLLNPLQTTQNCKPNKFNFDLNKYFKTLFMLFQEFPIYFYSRQTATSKSNCDLRGTRIRIKTLQMSTLCYPLL